MTVGVGVVEDGVVYLGYDSMTSNNWIAHNSVTKRPIQKGEMTILVSGSSRAAQLMQYRFDPPEQHKAMSDEEYMVMNVVDEIRRVFHEGGHASVENEQESSGAEMLIGYHGHLYIVQTDFQVLETHDDYAAIGSGQEVALGSLHSTTSASPKKRLRLALEAAAYHTPFVRGPFQIVTVGDKSEARPKVALQFPVLVTR